MVEVRVLRQKDILACPYTILVPTHYREDGRCRCDDDTHDEMVEWGYAWDHGTQRWVPATREGLT